MQTQGSADFHGNDNPAEVIDGSSHSGHGAHAVVLRASIQLPFARFAPAHPDSVQRGPSHRMFC